MALGRVALTAQAELARFQTPTIQRDASRQSAIHERVTRVATRLHVCCGAGRLCDVTVACDDGRAPALPGEGSDSHSQSWSHRPHSHGRPQTRPWRPSTPTAAKRCRRCCPRWIMFPATLPPTARAVGEARAAYI